LLTFPLNSPQDQAILEAEYKQNPKPNKAARAEIVEKVTLNEKEVQVRKPVLDAAGLQPDAFIQIDLQELMGYRYGSRTDAK